MAGRTTGLAPRLSPTEATVRVPIASSIEETTILFRQVRFSGRDIERDPETRPVPNIDESLFDDGVRQALDNVVPPFRLPQRILERDVVLRQRGRHVNVG